MARGIAADILAVDDWKHAESKTHSSILSELKDRNSP
jgi:hypothetical protein